MTGTCLAVSAPAGGEASGIIRARDYWSQWIVGAGPECVVAYLVQSEIEAFFRRDVSELDEYLRVMNLAQDLPPTHALEAVGELLEHAASEDDIALVGALALEPVVELHYRALGPQLEVALRANSRLRAALRSVIASGVPDDLRARLDATA